MHEIERFDLHERIADARARLHEKLAELSRRVQPSSVVRKPWVLAAAGIAGVLVGAMLRRTASSPRALARREPSIVRAVIREILIVAAGTATRRYLGTIRAPSNGA
jgi:hypothetical protein